MKFRQIIRDYFTFSRGERVGLTILIILMILVLAADQLIFYFETPARADRERFQEVLASLEQQTPEPATGSLFDFDPNTIDSVALDSLALSARIRQNMLRYRSRGGVFKKKEDLRKIYGMNDSVFAAIEKFLLIEERNVQVSVVDSAGARKEPAVGTNWPKSPEPAAVVRIDLNMATAGELSRLYGIGPVLSERIVKYRNLLGGFYSVAQLKEVYGLTDETIEHIGGQLDVDSTDIAAVNINFAEVAELAKHLYLDWDDARKIVEYRTKNGFIESKSQLLRDSVLTPEVFAKVRPYLQTSD